MRDNVKSAVEMILDEYSEYESYLDEKFRNSLKEKLRRLEKNYNCKNFAEDVYLSLIGSRLTLKRLCDISNKDDDLLISLFDKYEYLLKPLCKKLNIDYSEDYLLDAISSYDGSSGFPKHLLDTIRNSNNVEHKKVEDDNLEHKLQKYTKEKNAKKGTTLEVFAKEIDILSYVEENNNLEKYIYLKYGYYNNNFFDNKEIGEITNFDSSKINDLNIKSLELLKKITCKKIDKGIDKCKKKS